MKPFSLAHKIACYLKQKHGLADLNLLDLRDIIEQHEREAIAAYTSDAGRTQIVETSEAPRNTQSLT